MITPRMVDILWHDRECELNRRAEIARLMSDGPVVISEANIPILDWTVRILRYVRTSFARTASQVPGHEPPGDVPCV